MMSWFFSRGARRRIVLPLVLLLGLAVLAGLPCFIIARPACAQQAPPEDSKRPKSLLDYIRDGGMIGHSIIICSVIGTSLAIACAFQIRRDVLVPPEVLGQVEKLFEDEDYDEALEVCRAEPSFISSVLSAGLSRLGESFEEMKKAMEETGEAEATRLNMKIGYLSLIGAISPMLGLFGTVSGMITTFDIIRRSEVQPKPADLARGISEALVTTYEGLVVAIPMIILFNFFRNRITSVLLEAGEVTEALMARFKASSKAS